MQAMIGSKLRFGVSEFQLLSGVQMPAPDPLPHYENRSSGFIVFCQLLVRRGRMIFTITVTAFLTAVAAMIFLPNIYYAKTLLLPAQEDKGMMSAALSQMGGLAVLAGGAIGGVSQSDLFVGMLKSETIKDPIIDRFKLMDIYKKKYRTDMYAVLDKRVSISVGKKDGIISIGVEDQDPKRAADMANTYAEELQKLTVSLNMSGAGKNRTFLEERLVRAKADLAKAEDGLKTFQGKNKSINVTEQAKASIEGIARLRAELAVQEIQLSSLRRSLTDSTREVKDSLTTIANLKSQISRMEGSGSGASSIPSIGSMPTLGGEYIRLMREFKVQENLVELLTKQYEMARFSEAKDVTPFQILQKAKVPDKKIKPKSRFIVIMTTLTAFMGALVLAFVLEGFRDSRTGEEHGLDTPLPIDGRKTS
jgi:uncharacterized protein involved in exopolysaccharide biosynthesis